MLSPTDAPFLAFLPITCGEAPQMRGFPTEGVALMFGQTTGGTSFLMASLLVPVSTVPSELQGWYSNSVYRLFENLWKESSSGPTYLTVPRRPFCPSLGDLGFCLGVGTWGTNSPSSFTRTCLYVTLHSGSICCLQGPSRDSTPASGLSMSRETSLFSLLVSVPSLRARLWASSFAVLSSHLTMAHRIVFSSVFILLGFTELLGLVD